MYDVFFANRFTCRSNATFRIWVVYYLSIGVWFHFVSIEICTLGLIGAFLAVLND